MKAVNIENRPRAVIAFYFPLQGIKERFNAMKPELIWFSPADAMKLEKDGANGGFTSTPCLGIDDPDIGKTYIWKNKSNKLDHTLRITYRHAMRFDGTHPNLGVVELTDGDVQEL
jgi:hypothetical protein